MATNITSTSTRVLFEDEILAETQLIEEPKEKPKYARHIIWESVAFFSYLHLGALYGIYLSFTSAKLVTVLFAIFLYHCCILGITAGAHRLWAHRSYKAKWPLQLLLVIMNTMAYQNAAIHWARGHRLHHKYSDTDADPYNAKRGFFFSHLGWLFYRKSHPEVKEKIKSIDICDLKSNPLLTFQEKYYLIFMPLMCFILPTVIPVVCWNETWTNAYFISTVLRYVCALNGIGLVNSVAHRYGNKPYDKCIIPSENRGVSFFALGEGWHNYHHVFPWDYKAAEFGNYRLNLTTAFIDFFAKIGWAYDLKTVSQDMVKKRVERTGDDSHEVWGWNDKDQTQEERNEAIMMYHHTKDQ